MSEHEHGSKGCREIFEKLSEYLDHELAQDMRERIDGHLGDCAPCQEFLESLRRTVQMLESIERPTLPDQIRREVCEAYEQLKGRLEDD